MPLFVAERAIGGGNSGAGFTIPISVTGVVVGHHLIVALPIGSPGTGSVALSAVTDNQGNSWQINQSKIALASGNVRGAALASARIGAVGAGGALVITLSFGSTNVAIGYKVSEWSGLHPTAWFDVGNSGATAASQNMVTGSIDPASSGELVFAMFSPSVGETSFTPGAGYTQQGGPRSAAQEICVEYDESAGHGPGVTASGTVPAPGVASYVWVIGAYIKAQSVFSWTLADTGLAITPDTVVRQRTAMKAPLDNGLVFTETLTRTANLVRFATETGMVFFDTITASKPKTLSDVGIASFNAILRRFVTRLCLDTGVSPMTDSLLGAVNAPGHAYAYLATQGLNISDSLHLKKAYVRLSDTGVTVSDSFRHVSVTMPVRGAKRWMAGHGASSDVTM